ncbi:MAG: alpha/beta fold hydrolase, partial [Burkholderiales bacterium]
AKVRPEHFGTDRNVEDAEAVRRALGIPRWSVFGMSYGTTVAAEYLARHPGVIDAVVLDSLYPPDEFVPSVRLAQSRAIAQMLGECRADAACQARFPKLNPEAATRALAELDTQPLPFQLQGLRLTATEATVRGALHSLMYTEATARSVPWFLDAVVRRDGDTIAATLGQTLLAGDLVSRSDTSVSGLLGTDCRDRPRHHAPLVAGEGPTWMSLFNGLPHGACKAWPLGTPPGLPKGTSVPVLILSGAYDGFQIDANAVANAIGPAAQVVQIPHAAHTVIGAGKCPRSLVSNFIAAPKAVLNTSCMASMSAPPFLLDARPQPAAVALGARLQGSTPPPAALLAALGLICWLLAGLVLPVLRALGRRLRPAAFAPAAHPPVRGLWLAAMGAGFLSAVGLIAPLAGTVALNPGAATFGLDAGLAHVLWAWVAGGALALGVQMAALRRQQWLIAVAALGAVLMAVGALALGLAPWA